MRLFYERWYGFLPRTRLFCWSLFTVAVLLGAWLLLARPVIQQLSQLEATRSQAGAERAELWASEAQPHSVLDAPVIPALMPFSPLDFQTDGVRLVRWLPGAKGGELRLKVDWAQIPALFERLAQRGMAVSGFSVKPEETRLQLVLQVENTDAN